MTDNLIHHITQEIADLIGEAVNGVDPAKSAQIQFRPTHALPRLVETATYIITHAEIASLADATHVRRRQRLLDIILRWFDQFLSETGHTTPTAIMKATRAAYILKMRPSLLDSTDITFSDILSLHQTITLRDVSAVMQRRHQPLPKRPLIWKTKRYRLEELTHPTHVLVEGKALRHTLCTSYSPPWLEHTLCSPGTADAAHCLTAWRMIEQQDLRLFSLAGRQGPVLTLPLVTSHTLLTSMVGRHDHEPNGSEEYVPALIEALRALDDAIGPLFVAPASLNPALFARITAELPQLKAEWHYAAGSTIVIHNPPALTGPSATPQEPRR